MPAGKPNRAVPACAFSVPSVEESVGPADLRLERLRKALLYAPVQRNLHDALRLLRMLSHVDPASNSLACFAKPSLPRALWQLSSTLVPFVALWVAMAAIVVGDSNPLWAALLVIPASGLYVRLFVLQHDCSHGSFFRSARANRWVGAA